MAQTREIKRRIRSVKNTQQITRAMKMVAAAKLNRAQERMLKMRPYTETLRNSLLGLAIDLVGDEHPLLRPHPEVKRVATILIAGDRGLCGGFNNNVIRFAQQHMEKMAGVEHTLYTIGRRAALAAKKWPHTVSRSDSDVFEGLSYILPSDICTELVERFLGKHHEHLDEVWLVYNEFGSVIKQTPVAHKLLPFDLAALAAERREQLQEQGPEKVRPIYSIEPDPESVMATLVSRQLATQLFHACLESFAAEQAARMTAMDNATNNAGDLIDNLTLIYNRARQAGITGELLDIVGGANALQ